MSHLLSVFRRELLGYFITPLAYVFIVIFLFATGMLTFQLVGAALFAFGATRLNIQ